MGLIISNLETIRILKKKSWNSVSLNKIKLEGYEPVVIPYWGGKKTHWFDVTVVKNVNNMNDIFTGLPVQFNPLSVDCNAIAMQ